MLNLRHLISAYNQKTRSYAELLPWFKDVTPGLVLNLDGSLLAAFEYCGCDLESSNELERSACLDSVDIAWRAFDDHNTVWTFMDKRRKQYVGASAIPNPVARYIDDTWRSRIDSGQLGVVRHVVCIAYQPFGGSAGFFDEVSDRVVSRRQSFPQALAGIARQRLSRKTQIERMEGRLTAAIEAFEAQLTQFHSTLSARLELKRLVRHELRAELANRANIASPRAEVHVPPDGLYFLNTLLPTDTLYREAGGVIRFESPAGNRFVTMHSVKAYPGEADNRPIEQLLGVASDFTLASMFRFVDTERAKKLIQDQEQHYRSNVKGPLVQAVEKLTGITSERVNHGMAALADDAQTALIELTKEAVGYGYHAMAVQVIAGSREDNAASCQHIHAILNNAGYGLVKENVNALSAFALTLPGAADAVLRTTLVSTRNMSDLTIVRTLNSGLPDNPHLTEQRGVPSEALVLLPTRTDVPERFSLHVGDVGHFMVIGPAGAGKTTLMNFLISHWQRYEPCRVIVVDKGFSNYITLKALGGEYISLQDGQVEAAMNPARWMADAATVPKFRRWVELALRAFDDRPLTPENVQVLDKAIQLAAGQGGAHTLSKLYMLIAGQDKALASRLHAWTRASERYGSFFDNPEDSFALSDITGIEVGGLLADTSLAPAMLAYLFEVVEEKVDDATRPTLIYLEEAWYLLQNEAFRHMFEDWIKTMRKRNACVGIATQSLKDVRDSPISATLNDNIKTRIFLPNLQAFDSRDVYRDMLGLQDHEIEVIRNARQKRDYYVVQDTRRRLVDVQLPPEILSLTRSDARAKAIFHRELARGDDNWLARYMQEVIHG
ncbi:VirB4 family type IV secretion system protein [Rhizobacter sp. LjRoot28]|uniref:VirB4 family type IV secretion system protein n=1 Tax=Rhizobacter sp. LjRoot28 TaxID=3342309 RepID=UPI003ECDB3AF